MQHGAVLHRRAGADGDDAVVAAQHGLGPDRAAGTDRDVADDGGVGVDVGRRDRSGARGRPAHRWPSTDPTGEPRWPPIRRGMAEATTLEITVTPKQLGKHLRSVRRRKGLSLSEVARGAGLSRRELVAYERGKVPIPESDLWVLAGSCGVDVAELVPEHHLEGARRSRPDRRPASATPSPSCASTRRTRGSPRTWARCTSCRRCPPGKRIPVKDRELEAIAAALGGTPASIDQKLQEVLHVSPDEAAAPAGDDPRARRAAAAEPKALAPPPTPRPMFTPVAEPAAANAAPIGRPGASARAGPDVPRSARRVPRRATRRAARFAARPQRRRVRGARPPARAPAARRPVGAGARPPRRTDRHVRRRPLRLAPLVGAPVSGRPRAPSSWSTPAPGALAARPRSAWPADAPPIDVAMRQGSDRWDLGHAARRARRAGRRRRRRWDTTDWQPPTPPAATAASRRPGSGRAPTTGPRPRRVHRTPQSRSTRSGRALTPTRWSPMVRPNRSRSRSGERDRRRTRHRLAVRRRLGARPVGVARPTRHHADANPWTGRRMAA